MQNKFILTADASKHDHSKGPLVLGTSIYVGDWYTYGGTVYECILAHTATSPTNVPPNTTYWTPVVAAGTPLGSVNWRGTWGSGTTYAAGDGCTLTGHAYVSIVGSNLNHSPPNITYWVEVYYNAGIAGPGSSVDSNLVEFSGTDGLTVKDSLIPHASLTSGWLPAPTLTFGAADAPTYTVTCAGDYSAIITPGMRMKMTQGGSVKYFIVTASAYGAPNTTITLYGGTDYTLGATITLPYYSMVKAPAGFPMDPAKWTVTKTDGSDRSVSTPGNNTLCNPGTTNCQLILPIGAWYLGYHVFVVISFAGTPSVNTMEVALSNANNTAAYPALTRLLQTGSTLGPQFIADATMVPLAVAVKTTLYLNASSNQIGTTVNAIDFRNDWGGMAITAVSAYL